MHDGERPDGLQKRCSRVGSNKVNSLSDARGFSAPETASSSGMSHVLSQPSRIQSPRGMISRDSGFPHHTRNSMSTSGNALFNSTCSERISPKLPGTAMRRRRIETRKNRKVQQYRLYDFPGILMPGILCVVLEELLLKIVRWKLRGMLPQNCISENSLTQMTFSAGESTSRPKCA